MIDLRERSKDMKDKIVSEGKEAHDGATDDKSKETERRAQSLSVDIKGKARNLGDGVKDKFSRKDEKK